MDVSQEMIQHAKEYLKQNGHYAVTLVKNNVLLMDPTNATTQRRLVQEQHHHFDPTVIFIDIGGNRDLSSVLRVLQWCRSTYSPRLICVKNQALVDTCSTLNDVTTITITTNGRIHGAESWFQQQQQQNTSTCCWPEHALQAPLVLHENIPICRYHNYHDGGCKKQDKCPFNHSHCHLCQQEGHVAKTCPLRNE
jgi:hypothetical protein